MHRLHVLITPTGNQRALFSSLAALSAAREPRLEVTAIAPASGHPALSLDRRFRLLPCDKALVANPVRELDLGEGSVLFVLRAGALPPRGWLETLLEHGKQTEVRAVAACGWQPNDSNDPEHGLRRWEKQERLARRSFYRLVEDQAELESPLLAIFRPTELASELGNFMASGYKDVLCLRPATSHALERLLVAKDLLVFQDSQVAPLQARIVFATPETPLPTSIQAAEALSLELHAQLEHGPHPEINLRLAKLALSLGHREKAIVQARACLGGWPECTEAKLYMARALTGEGRLSAARGIIEDLLHAGPLRQQDRALVFACLASIWLHSAEPAQAQPCLDVALSIAPNNSLARYCQARIALTAGRFGEALEHLEVSLAAAPLSPDMHFELGRTRVLAGMEQLGRKSLERALELNPEHKKAEALLERLGPLH